MTFPNLMEMPSLALSPVAPVLFSRSEPARSTKWNFAVSVSNSSVLDESLASRLSISPSCWNRRGTLEHCLALLSRATKIFLSL
uniref:Uncharacterized protein n=1 Tax=Electrophorus electricus TaxID=8005 RepID=A0A4W4E8G6_ELEEL